MPAKKKVESCDCGCGCPCCSGKSMKGMKAHGIFAIIVGLLVLANAYYPTISWSAFIGALVVVLGIAKLMHNCK